jgi:hypothetical protein
MVKRKHVSSRVEGNVLVRSRRRCALCFGLEGDTRLKPGQIAHIDRNAQNDDEDNLVFLCLTHHDIYDSATSQSKGLKAYEVRYYRDRLYDAVAELSLPSNAAEPCASKAVVADARPEDS